MIIYRGKGIASLLYQCVISISLICLKQGTEITLTVSHLCFPGEDTMTGDGGEYLRAEDLRDLGDDSLPGHYLDFSYMNNMNIDR